MIAGPSHVGFLMGSSNPARASLSDNAATSRPEARLPSLLPTLSGAPPTPFIVPLECWNAEGRQAPNQVSNHQQGVLRSRGSPQRRARACGSCRACLRADGITSHINDRPMARACRHPPPCPSPRNFTAVCRQPASVVQIDIRAEAHIQVLPVRRRQDLQSYYRGQVMPAQWDSSMVSLAWALESKWFPPPGADLGPTRFLGRLTPAVPAQWVTRIWIARFLFPPCRRGVRRQGFFDPKLYPHRLERSWFTPTSPLKEMRVEGGMKHI